MRCWLTRLPVSLQVKLSVLDKYKDVPNGKYGELVTRLYTYIRLYTYTGAIPWIGVSSSEALL